MNRNISAFILASSLILASCTPGASTTTSQPGASTTAATITTSAADTTTPAAVTTTPLATTTPLVTTTPQNGALTSIEAIYSAESGSVTKINAQTNEVEAAITLEGSAHNVQISADKKVMGITLEPGHGAAAGVTKPSTGMNMPGMSMPASGSTTSHTDMDAGFAEFYNADSLEKIARVQVGKHPAHIVFTDDGKYALVTNNESNDVTVIDAQSYEALGTIKTGKGPHGFRISNDSNTAYVANMGEDTVSVLDIAQMKETRKITVGNHPVTTGITSDNKKLLTTLNGEDTLAVVDLETDQVQKIPVGHRPIQLFITSNDEFAFVANEGTKKSPGNTVTKISLLENKTTATIQVGQGAHGVVISEDDRFVYVTNTFDDTVSVIDAQTDDVVRTIPVGSTPNGITAK